MIDAQVSELTAPFVAATCETSASGYDAYRILHSDPLCFTVPKSDISLGSLGTIHVYKAPRISPIILRTFTRIYCVPLVLYSTGEYTMRSLLPRYMRVILAGLGVLVLARKIWGLGSGVFRFLPV